MVCIYCGKKTRVTNSRPQLSVGQTWRRHECNSCHALFTTTEQVAFYDVLRVKKRSGRIENFQRDKLFLSIYRSCDHINNSTRVSSQLTSTVIARLFAKKPMSPIVGAIAISKVCSQVLKAYNAAASVRYLSFQSDMKQANDVRRSLKNKL